MRKIILMKPVPVDGLVEGPERELGWHKVDELAWDFSPWSG